MQVGKLLHSATVVLAMLIVGPMHQTQLAAQAAAKTHLHADAIALPVRRVALYKNGVGFFEHVGTVSGNQQVTIDFTTAQLNDVLQSLTAVDLNGGHIAGAGYNSTTPLEQQIKALPLSLGAHASALDLYQAMRGARVAVRSGNESFTGRMLGIEVRLAKAGINGSVPLEERYLTVVSDTGTVRTVEMLSNTEVQLLDAKLDEDVRRYLQLLGSTQSGGLRHLTLAAHGSGLRELHVSYLSEVPIWKATYRILFSRASTPATSASKERGTESATLQGWAVVDNTVGADWENVELSLIAGAPQSFIQPISQPYYARRPEIGLPQEAQLTPQTHESGRMLKNELMGQGTGAGMASAEAGALGGSIGGLGSGPAPVVKAAAPMLSYEDSVAASVALNTDTTGFDDYFEYKLASPITIRKNESALVPILQTKVEAERVTLWSPAQPQALRALWLKNTSKLTLDRGSFSIVEDGRFGGEGLLEPIHPQERRLLSYAADQAVRVSVPVQNETNRLQQVAVSKGVLTQRNVEAAEREYVVSNAASEARNVIVEHPLHAGWELDSEAKPVETTATAYRFRVAVPAGETARLRVTEHHVTAQSYQLASMESEQLIYLLRTSGENPRLRLALAPLFDAKRRLAELEAQRAATQKAVDAIAADQKRLRENMAVLKGSPEERALVRRYTDELNGQEDKLAALRREQEGLHAREDAATAELSEKIEALQVQERVD